MAKVDNAITTINNGDWVSPVYRECYKTPEELELSPQEQIDTIASVKKCLGYTYDDWCSPEYLEYLEGKSQST